LNTFEVLQKLDRDTSAEVYLVGGYVRDLIRNKKNDDLDIVVRKISIKHIASFLRKYGKVKKVDLSKTSDAFEISMLLFKAHGDYIEAQITLPRKGKKQITDPSNLLKHDVLHRDFTINGLYLPINYKSKAEAIDLVGGKLDIYHRKIFAIGNPEDRLIESPARILRAISLAARTGYTIDKGLTQQIFNNRHLLMKVPIENIREELNKVLISKKPSKYLKLMYKLGLLKFILPELERCKGVKQDSRYHKWDVFEHCVQTCDHVEPDLVLRMAGLLHDVGKVDTRKVQKNGRTTFHKHEIDSFKKARVALKRLRYPNSIEKKILHLIKLHMYHYTREFSDSAVRRFIKRAGITEEDLNHLDDLPLFKLRIADRLGNGLKNIPITEKQKDFQKRIVRVYKESRGLSIKDLAINGEDLMKKFNLKPSPLVGEILNHLLTKILERPNVNNINNLIDLAEKYLKEKNLKKSRPENMKKKGEESKTQLEEMYQNTLQ
jgi:tRNA nucleotidyltransferase (CCA-adding enzyme)